MQEKDNIIFSTTDPLNRVITLKEDTWSKHIIEESGHTEVTAEYLKNNVESPRYILRNVKPKEDGSKELIVDETRQDYIDIIPMDGKIYCIKTIVEFDESNSGTIVTNYIQRRVTEIKTIGGVVYDSKQGKNTI